MILTLKLKFVFLQLGNLFDTRVVLTRLRDHRRRALDQRVGQTADVRHHGLDTTGHCEISSALILLLYLLVSNFNSW